MLICTKPKHQNLRTAGDNLCLNIMRKDLHVVQEVKYFGVQVDNSLDWKDHIKVISSKVSKAVGLLKHAKTFLPDSSLISLYLSIVEPHSHCCCSVWRCSGSNIFLEPEKLQNRVTRILKKSAFDASSSPIIEKLGRMKIGDLISFDTNQLVFQSLKTVFLPRRHDMK